MKCVTNENEKFCSYKILRNNQSFIENCKDFYSFSQWRSQDFIFKELNRIINDTTRNILKIKKKLKKKGIIITSDTEIFFCKYVQQKSAQIRVNWMNWNDIHRKKTKECANFSYSLYFFNSRNS